MPRSGRHGCGACAGCSVLDLDTDGDIDLRDFAAFQILIYRFTLNEPQALACADVCVSTPRP
ncbi:MAG: hypothetical protein WBE26_01740 [Phycisphaerae bacterium]